MGRSLNGHGAGQELNPDSVLAVWRRQKVGFGRSFFIGLYYGLAIHLPDTPMPGSTIGMYLRRLCARHIFRKLGPRSKVGRGVNFGSGIAIEMGRDSAIGVRSWIANDTVIGDDVMMAPEVVILSGSHDFEDVERPMREQGGTARQRVVIGSDVWIGTRAIILRGVTVGDHSIVGAGAVVTRDVPPWSIVGGNPARLIRNRLNGTSVSDRATDDSLGDGGTR